MEAVLVAMAELLPVVVAAVVERWVFSIPNRFFGTFGGASASCGGDTPVRVVDGVVEGSWGLHPDYS